MRWPSVAGLSGAVARGGTGLLCVASLLLAHAGPIGEPRPSSEEVMRTGCPIRVVRVNANQQ